MTVEFSVITEFSQLEALREPWRELADLGGHGALFRGPDWLLPWWQAYRQVLGAELYVLLAREGEDLIAMAPFYTREVSRGPGAHVREIRLLGDAGPRPPALDLLFAPAQEDSAGAALANYLDERASDWDLIDLAPLRDPSRGRAVMVSRLANRGFGVQSQHAGGARRIALAVAGIDIGAETQSATDEAAGSVLDSLVEDAGASAYVGDPAALRKGLSALRRLSRLEWSAREEASPLADREAGHLLEDVALRLSESGRARLARLNDSSGEAIATALVVDDGDRAVIVAIAVDPQHEQHASARLLAVETRAAAARGRQSLDVVTGATEHPLPHLPITRQRALSVSIYSRSGAATVARTYGAVRRRVEAAREAQGMAAASARAAWAKIRTAAEPVAGYKRMHLYRGELWTRGVAPTPGLTIEVLSEEGFDAFSDELRGDILRALDWDEGYCRDKWRRGDLAVFAHLGPRPAGIAWCARGPVLVPALERTLDLAASEAYIQDVFVAPEARGQAVARSMLDFLAAELRQRDVYRAWALIDSENIASVRAFEKAAYMAVADVIRAHIANVDRLIVRPPDAEARQLLGLT